MRSPRLLLLALVTLALPASAQVIQQSGHSLDSNLRLGSGGYNGVGAIAGGRAIYGPGGLAHVDAGGIYGGRELREPIYRVRSPDYYNAFQRERSYRPDRGLAYDPDQVRVVRPQEPQMPPPLDSGYAAGFDAGYEAALAEGAAPAVQPTPEARQQMDMISYGVGYFLGEEVLASVHKDGVDGDLESLVAGFRDGLEGNEPQVSRQRLERILADMHKEVRQRMVQHLLDVDPEFKRQHDENLARSRSFHETYGRTEGVVTLPDGIQYKVLAEGSGRHPGPDDVVVVNYRLLGLDGHLIAEGEQAEVAVNELTEGGRKIIQMMPEGARWEVAIPPELAHGAAGQYPNIGPNETVFGTVELVKIK